MKAMVGGVVLCMGVLTATASAQVIYKCVVKGAITYQQDPCPAQEAAKGVSSDTALIGQWRSDRDTTMAWLKRHDTLTKTQEAEMGGLAGHMAYTFAKDRVTIEVADYDIALPSGVLHKKGGREELPYSVLSASPQVVGISAQNPNNLGVYRTDFHFEGHDVMWISLANQRLTAVDNPNARWYFKRAR